MRGVLGLWCPWHHQANQNRGHTVYHVKNVTKWLNMWPRYRFHILVLSLMCTFTGSIYMYVPLLNIITPNLQNSQPAISQPHTCKIFMQPANHYLQLARIYNLQDSLWSMLKVKTCSASVISRCRIVFLHRSRKKCMVHCHWMVKKRNNPAAHSDRSRVRVFVIHVDPWF